MASKTLTVTPASEWQKASVIMELPSGKVVEAQRVNASTIIMEDGTIPDDIYPYMIQMISNTITEDEARTNPKAIKAGLLIANTVTMKALISPRCARVADIENNIISIDAIDDADKQFLSMWAMGGGDEKALLKRFRDALQKRLAAAQNGISI